ncbi:MAG: DUF3152 domain-containing protein [Propioniciclava sp.]|uniref:DUF3152 domain-containing protein n=1 Tax=Propioniciclava sp. TaxID=2038686 RepID=UPI0039E454B0
MSTGAKRPGSGNEAVDGDPAAGSRRWWFAFAVIVVAVLAAGAFMLLRAGSLTRVVGAASTPTPSIPEIARQQVWTSDTPASGTFLTNTIALPPAIPAPKVVRYQVKVEDSTGLDADAVAREVQATFDDPRGWAGYGKRTFELVTDPEQAGLVIFVASPPTTNELCKPAKVESKWNCRVGRTVALNSDRWQYMTPTYDDLGAYRSYLVNHEVGHFLGLGHSTCPREGAPAPVMMQQSIKLGGCTPNAWPKLAD